MDKINSGKVNKKYDFYDGEKKIERSWKKIAGQYISYSKQDMIYGVEFTRNKKTMIELSDKKGISRYAV